MEGPNRERPHRPSILSFAGDLPNLCSLAGLFCALLGIYYAIRGVFPAAMIGILWAVVFDWCDGMIARRIQGRTQQQRAIGSQLDSLIDVVSFSVCPAVVLLSYGKLSPWCVPGAFVILSAGVLRLSYFNVFGLADKSTYTGLAIDNNGIVLAFVFLFEGLVGRDTFTVILYATLMALAAMNVAPVRTPKLTGGWYYVLVIYTLVMTAVFGWRWAQLP
jgi:CDP-diacylglycerol--serine O-phosphatidyltransferase